MGRSSNWFVAKRVDTRTRKIAVIDRTGELYPALEKAAATYNSQSVDPDGKAIRPRIEISRIDSRARGEVAPVAGARTFRPRFAAASSTRSS